MTSFTLRREEVKKNEMPILFTASSLSLLFYQYVILIIFFPTLYIFLA